MPGGLLTAKRYSSSYNTCMQVQRSGMLKQPKPGLLAIAAAHSRTKFDCRCASSRVP